MSERKTELLDAAIAFLARSGVAGLSLRPLASAIDTSPRLLIFHFKSKEGLLADVMDEIQRRLQESFVAMTSAKPGSRGESPMKAFWRWATNNQNLPLLRILYEAHFISLQKPAAFRSDVQKSPVAWADIIEGSLPAAIRSKAMATLCGAAFDGLVIELIGSGDLRRTTQSLDLFIEMMAARISSRAA